MIERVDQAAALQRTVQTASVKSEQASTEAAQTAQSNTEIVLRYPTDQVEISEEGLAKAVQQSVNAAMRGGAAQAGGADVPKGAGGAGAKPASANAQSAQATQTTETTQSTESAESKELESAKRTVEQMESATETAETEAEESATQSTSNLASLTEQQIETLVKEGSITRAEADNELASRVDSEG